MIEWRWNLPPLTVRDATAANLADLLDFSTMKLDAPTFDVPTGPFGARCPPASAAPTHWDELQALARQYGFPTP
jgi:phospholipase C